jgi:flagellar hook assembly protein FlgD
LPEAIQVDLSIYNIIGQRVKVLADEFQTAAIKSVTWDGKDNQERIVTNGTYLYKLETADYLESKKMLLLK